MPRVSPDCRHCRQARRLASLCFAAFALALLFSARAPAFDPAEQALLFLCGLLTGLAAIRHVIAAMLGRLGRMSPIRRRAQ